MAKRKTTRKAARKTTRRAAKKGAARAKKRVAAPRRRAARTRRAVRTKARKQTAAPARRKDGVAPGMQPISTYLVVKNITASLDFYERAFGFKRRTVVPGPDGQPTHAEMTHGESVLMMGSETAEFSAPASPGATPVTLYAYVQDVDRTTEQARNAGGAIYLEPKDEFWGDRVAGVIDPEGHRWMLATFKKLVPFDQLHQT